MKLTQKVVDTLVLPPGKAELFAWDDDVPGLAVRIQGKRTTWVVQSRVAGGRQQRVTLGPVAGISLKVARVKAGAILADAKDGKSASAERHLTRQRTETTLGIVCDLYLKRQAEPKQRPKTLAQTKRYLDKAWLPLRSVPVAALTRAEVAKRLNEIALESGPIAANRARAALGAACSWAMRQGLMEANPCLALDKPGTEVRRDRHLSEAEIVALWKATESADDYSAIVRVLLLTGQRREEVAAMTWAELDLDKALWSLPAARTKNRQAHDVPLSESVLRILRGRKSEGRKYVFGLRRGPFSGFSKAKPTLDARLAKETATAWPAWVLHDIRRSTVTGMVEIGIAPHIVEAVVNHISGHKGGVAGVYNKAAYRTEKQAALERWAAHVEALVSGQRPGNVVELARAGR